jgi:hypothetical protein
MAALIIKGDSASDEVCELLKRGSNPNVVLSNIGLPVLHFAARSGFVRSHPCKLDGLRERRLLDLYWRFWIIL